MATLAAVENKIYSRSLGELTFKPEDVILFPEGLIGFENSTNFIIVERDEYKPFSWLVCVDDPSISLPIVNPFLVDAKYKAISSNGELKSIGLDSISIDQVYAVVTVGDNIGQVSVNLKSPIIINKKRSLGKQNILLDSTYSLKHPILAGSHTN